MHSPLTSTLKISLTCGVCCGELFWHHTFKLADVSSQWKHLYLQSFCAETCIRGEWATAFSSNTHKSSQVDEQIKVLLKEDSGQMKVYSQAVFPQVQQYWHLFVDKGWKGKMCALALAASVLPKASKVQPDSMLINPRGSGNTPSLTDTHREAFTENAQSGDSFTPTMHSNKCSSPGCQSLEFRFPSFFRIFICSLRNNHPSFSQKIFSLFFLWRYFTFVQEINCPFCTVYSSTLVFPVHALWLAFRSLQRSLGDDTAKQMILLETLPMVPPKQIWSSISSSVLSFLQLIPCLPYGF